MSLLGKISKERIVKNTSNYLFTSPIMAKELSECAEVFKKYWKHVLTNSSASGETRYVRAEDAFRKSASLAPLLFESEEKFKLLTKGKYIGIVLSGESERTSDVLKRNKLLVENNWCLGHVEVTGENYDDEFAYMIDGDWVKENIQRFVSRSSKLKFALLYDDLLARIAKLKEFPVCCQVMLRNDAGELSLKVLPLSTETSTTLDKSIVRGLVNFIRFIEEYMK